MTVIVIFRWDYSVAGVVNNYRNAVDYLIRDGWIDDNTEIWNDASNQWEKLIDLQGKNWANRMRDEWDIEDFNYFFEGLISLEMFDVIGTDKEKRDEGWNWISVARSVGRRKWSAMTASTLTPAAQMTLSISA